MLGETGLNNMYWAPPTLGSQWWENILWQLPNPGYPVHPGDMGPTGELQPGAVGGE